MLARRFKCKNQRWEEIFQSLKYSIRLYGNDCLSIQCNHGVSITGSDSYRSNYVRQHMLESCRTFAAVSSFPFIGRSYLSWQGGGSRFYSSKDSGGNARDEEHVSVRDGVNFDKNGAQQIGPKGDALQYDQHARLGEQDQKEWLKNEKQAIENKIKQSPFLTRGEKLKNEFLRRIVPWEKITVSWETFPYYVHDHTKSLLMDCASSHIQHKKLTSAYGSRLRSSSGRILLQSAPGTELYRERLVRALARELKVPLLVLDSSVLAPYDFGDDGVSENDSDDEHEDSGEEEGTSKSEDEDENEEEWASNVDTKSDATEDEESDVQSTAEALMKLIPFNLEEFEKRVSGECESSSETSNSESVDNQTAEVSQRPLRKGDRIKYIGSSVHVEADNREIPAGQRGEVYEVEKGRVAVILDKGEKDESTEQDAKPLIYWIPVKDIECDHDAQAENCYIAVEALCKVLQSQQPLIVYFPDSSLWLSRAAPKSNRAEFVSKVGEMFDQLSGPVVLISGQNKVETGSKEKESFKMVLPNFGRLAKLPLTLRRLTEGFKATKRSDETDLNKLFTNVVCIHPPKEEEQLVTFNKQLEEDRRIVISRSNLNELHKVLEEHELACLELLQVDTDGLVLTKQKAEKVVGWAKNHYLASCVLPSIRGDRLNLPCDSLEVAISRLKEQETLTKKPSQKLKNLAKDEYENNFVSAVVPSGEIGVRFDDVGALEDVKKTLNELVILPMRRPELFSHGNLLRPCKGILLFGPPGTGKTLLAKALATEAGANFISITGSNLTSKWFGDAEKLTKALFSFASKLTPVIIFVDEVDSLLGARGGAVEHEATRRMRNEFMAAWDGLRTKDSQRILILGATNRPFDLDDAVIRRLPRRIYVDLPDVENRMKILKIFLAQENLEPNFRFDELANVTEGYSGSDLKNLCIAAAYRPVQELLEEENKAGKNDTSSILRPLGLDDFVQSKSKVGPSVAYDAASMNELRKWNEQYGEGGSRKKSPFGF
ncbi:unnamed protein product [Amaranthus hypochondriacus]